MTQLEQFEKLYHDGKSTKQHIKPYYGSNDEMYKAIEAKRKNLNDPTKLIEIPQDDESGLLSGNHSTSSSFCKCSIL